MRGRELNISLAKMLRVLLIAALAMLPVVPLQADLRTAPTWFDQNAVTTTPDWHYRVPVTIGSGNAVNSTVKVDVDFNALLTQMGVTGTFDVNSPRVVRSTGALSTTQEFTDRVYAGATDAAGDGRGEVRFILEDAGPATYYIYFDITQNGAKAVNPQSPIDGNFEHAVASGSATGLAAPLGWVAPTKASATYNSEVRPTEIVPITDNPAPVDTPATRNTDGSPYTADYSYMLGWRNATAAQTNGAPGVTFTRTIAVPATNPGNLVFKYRVEGWDSYDGGTGYDFLRADVVGTTTTEMVGPTAGSYNTKPFSPNTGSAIASATTSGYRQYNGFDCDLTGVHRSAGTLGCHSEPWITVTQSLAAYAGQTVTLRFRAFTETQDITWYHIDDVEWSVSTGTLGTPQAFGVNITSPAPSTTYTPGQILPITAQVDANPTAATNPVTALIYDTTGALMPGGPYILYNDGTHGDAVAGDAIWSNNGSVLAQPAPTVPLSATNGTGYTLRVFANDAATSGGLAHIPGAPAPQTQANFYNIDEILFNVNTAALTYTKTSSVISDPVNGVSANAKMIPGALVRYCLLVSNAGPLSATGISQSDTLPVNITYVAGSLRSGTACATAATVEDDNNTGADESDPDGASFAAGVIAAVRATLAASASMAITFDVTIN